MSKFFFYKVGRHFILCDIQKAERYRISLMRRNRANVFHLSTTDVTLPSYVVAETRDAAVAWLKMQKWREL